MLLTLFWPPATVGTTIQPWQRSTTPTGPDDASDAAATDTASDEDLEEQGLAFAQCMRENGVPDFPDPQVNGDGGMIMGGGPDGGGH